MQPTGRSPAVSGVAPDNRTRHATTSQQWLPLISAGLAWLFDATDLQIFTVVLFPSVSALIGSTDSGRVAGIGGIIVACKLLSWGVGGIVFGVVADRVGRARTMLITVLIYSAFTGLSALAQTWWQLAVLQALAGIGLGGEWAAGAALVAESWPERTRARATQVMQMCFGLGFFAAAALNLFVGPFGWRWVFVAGVAPAPIILVLRLFVRESPRWLAVRQQRPIDARRDSKTATLRAIFAPGMRRRTVVATLIALAMMLGSNSLAPIAPTWVHQLLPHDQQPLAGRTISHFYMLASFGRLLRHCRSHVADRTAGTPPGVFGDRARLCGDGPRAVSRRHDRCRPADGRACLSVLRDRRLWLLRCLFSRVVPNRDPRDGAGLRMEPGAIPRGVRSRACRRPGPRPRLPSRRRACRRRRLRHRPRCNLVRPGDEGTEATGLNAWSADRLGRHGRGLRHYRR
jgi:MFS family permease